MKIKNLLALLGLAGILTTGTILTGCENNIITGIVIQEGKSNSSNNLYLIQEVKEYGLRTQFYGILPVEKGDPFNPGDKVTVFCGGKAEDPYRSIRIFKNHGPVQFDSPF